MDYREARNFIADAQKYGIVPGLDSIRRLLDRLGNPHESLKIIHIAGTNGKGSVGAFIESILRKSGYSTCRYSSPAVFEYEEIFRYNGKNIEKNEFAALCTIVKDACREIAKNGYPHPTPFEIETAIAFLYCKEKNCDYAVLESGMGGKDDAVNVISKSEVSVLTSISMDHTKFLGGTLEEIALHKAGIIKENGTVVSGVQKLLVYDVIRIECTKKNASLYVADKISNVQGNIFDYGDMRDIKISLNGAFQIENAATAIEVSKRLGIEEGAIREGLKNTVWRGRFEKISCNPVFIIDGAHNTDAAIKLKETIEAELGDRKINFIIGVLADKEYKKIAKITAPLASCIYTVTPDNPRALNNTEFAKAVRRYNPNVTAADLETAVSKCLENKDAVTIAFGSLSYLKDVLRIVENEKM